MFEEEKKQKELNQKNLNNQQQVSQQQQQKGQKTSQAQIQQTQQQQQQNQQASNNQSQIRKSQVKPSVIQFYSKYRKKNSKPEFQEIQGNIFEISEEDYQLLEIIGKGAYGIVVAAIDKHEEQSENKVVAIKKIEKAFEHKVYTKRTLRELKILRLLQHDNVSTIKTIILPQSREQFEDIYVVSEYMDVDLFQVIYHPQELNDEHCQFFIYQILRGLKYIHSCGILHRDLKPRNILVKENCDIKICDFGLARAQTTKNNLDMTNYVTTRWYRAPELLLEGASYTASVDVWSVGCILAEILRRQPLWKGTDTRHQIELILEILGTPTLEQQQHMPKQWQKKISKIKKHQGKNIYQLFPKAQKLALDLLVKLLQFDPEKRISVNEALQHPYLSQYHDPNDEPTADQVSELEFEFERHIFTMEQLKDLIYEEILLYHYEDFKIDYTSKINNNQSVIKHILDNDNSQIQDNDSDEEDEVEDDNENSNDDSF